MVQIPSPLGRLPIAWVVEAAISVLSQQPPARLLWRTEGAAGASVIYRGGKVSRQTCSAVEKSLPTTVPDTTLHHPSHRWGALTCEGILKARRGIWCPVATACALLLLSKHTARWLCWAELYELQSLLSESFICFGLQWEFLWKNTAAMNI